VRRPELRLTVDTEADLAFMQTLVAAVGLQTSPAPLSALISAADRLNNADGDREQTWQDVR
jgi:spore coat polysaccharide biosynthesis protein SpsF (cytidylyltransferase family)